MQQRIFRDSRSYSVHEDAGEVTAPRLRETVDGNPIQYRSLKADVEAGCVATLVIVGSQAVVSSSTQGAGVRWARWR